MPQHTIIALKEGSIRARCTVCLQTWTSRDIRSSCPGARVYHFEELPSYLKTPTALWREERKVPPDYSKPNGAYRILKAPYYRLVYDSRSAIAQPLTERQIAANEKRKATMRQRYGCKLCDTYYRKDDLQWFKNGVCQHCQNAAGSWNSLIEWARHMLQEEAIILDITTEPEKRPISFTGQAPNCYYEKTTNTHLIAWSRPETFTLTGYQALSLTSGDVIHCIEQFTDEKDYIELRHLLIPPSSALVPYPLVLMTSDVTAEIAYRAARESKQQRERNPNLELLPIAYYYLARTGRTWTRILESDGSGRTERQHLEYAATTCEMQLEQDESTSALLRRFVLHLAAQERIEMEEDQP